MAIDPMADRWMRPTEAAQYLGISTRTLYRMKDKGTIKFSYLGTSGRQARFRLSDLIRYMEQRSVGRIETRN